MTDLACLTVVLLFVLGGFFLAYGLTGLIATLWRRRA